MTPVTRLSSEGYCRQLLFKTRWPKGFVCPRCQCQEHWDTNSGHLLCRRCRRQVSLTVGTAFDHSHLPLTTWFGAMWQMIQNRDGISAPDLQERCQLGSNRTAIAMLNTIRGLMAPTSADELRGSVRLDLADVRTAGGPAWVLIACQKDGAELKRIRLSFVQSGSVDGVGNAILNGMAGRTDLEADGDAAYGRLTGSRELHFSIRKPKPSLRERTRVCETVVSGLQIWMNKIHGGAVRPHHLQNYMNEFCFRFNHCRGSPRLGFQELLRRAAPPLLPTAPWIV